MLARQTENRSIDPALDRNSFVPRGITFAETPPTPEFTVYLTYSSDQDLPSAKHKRLREKQ